VSVPDILEIAHWLQRRHDLYLFRVDHPGRPVCGGTHAECDGQRGKHPWGRWPRLATVSGTVIRAVLADDPPWNLAVACKHSGLVVADDDDHGAVERYAASVGETVPPTFAVNTAKGRHYYFRQDPAAPLGNGEGRLRGLGINIRGGAGNGGYVVAPGSVHETGVIYTPVDSSAKILPVPGWLAEALRPVSSTVPARRYAPVPLRPGSHAERVLTGLVDKVLHAQPPAPGVGGERNNLLFWAACQGFKHVSHGLLTEADVRSSLLEAAIQNGLGHAGALATIDSARRNVFEGGAV
jgi:Bifunctional DNA primase/polymerase, N-terminal